jgi:hypothetical protein
MRSQQYEAESTPGVVAPGGGARPTGMGGVCAVVPQGSLDGAAAGRFCSGRPAPYR